MTTPSNLAFESTVVRDASGKFTAKPALEVAGGVSALDAQPEHVDTASMLPLGVTFAAELAEEDEADGRDDGHVTVLYVLADGEGIGYLSWYDDGRIEMVDVDEEWQRMGIATALWNEVRTKYAPALHHDPATQSPESRAWANSIGD